MSPRLATLALASLGALGLVEWGAAAWAYRDRIEPDHWAALRASLGDTAEPIVLGTQWLGPSARREVPGLRGAAPADLVDASAFTMVGLGELDVQLDLAGPTELVDRTDVGPFVVERYRQPDAFTRLAALGPESGLQVFLGDEACSGRGPWRCKSANVERQWVEVDYRPRWCLTVDAHDGATVRLRAPSFPLGDRLRGHVGFADFNGRLRSDAPATITLVLDEAVVGRFVATDAQGWHPFEVDTTPGRGDLEVRVLQPTIGTFGSEGYAHRPNRPLCLELRSLAAGGPP